MLFLQALFSALLAVPAVVAVPHMALTARGAPKSYSGPASGFPAMSEWTDFDTMVSISLKELFPSEPIS